MSKCSDYLFKVQSEVRGLTCRTCIRLIQELSFQKKTAYLCFLPLTILLILAIVIDYVDFLTLVVIELKIKILP